MKVIVASYEKTGTKTINAALTELGFKVYDYLEHFQHHHDDWCKILQDGGSTEDFKRMYQGVDAVVDDPVFHFWEEIYKAFPEAKIILTVREEESWYASFYDEMDRLTSDKVVQLMYLITPTGRRLFRHFKLYSPITLGVHLLYPFFRAKINELLVRLKFRQHIAYVKQSAPSDKLLVLNLREGWEPLCKFLGKDVPTNGFPCKNVKGEEIIKLMEEHPVYRQMRKEFHFLMTGFFVSVGVLAGGWLYKHM